MTVLGIASLVILLLEFATRVIELFLVIRSALLTRRGKERHKYTQTAEAIREPWGVHAPCGSPLLYKTVHYSQEGFRADSRVALAAKRFRSSPLVEVALQPVTGRSRTSIMTRQETNEAK